jgi:hypothetical protein
MRVLFCDCCGDLVKAVYPCRFVFHDGLTCDFKVCPDCMENGTLEIDLKRKRLVAQLLLIFRRPARGPIQ